MDLSKILSISGRSGLFKVINQGKNTVIVESLTEEKRFPVFGHEKMSSLEEISVFSTGEDLPLKEIFKSLFEKLEGKEAIDPKSDQETVKTFFYEIVPEIDRDRVYVSDIRKMLTWYNLLVEKGMLDFAEEAKPDGEEQPSGEPVTEVKPEKQKEENLKPVRQKIPKPQKAVSHQVKSKQKKG